MRVLRLRAVREATTVPRYIFHLCCDQVTVPDLAAADLRDADEAWEMARATARDLLKMPAGGNVNWLTCHVQVTDEAGETVLEFPFIEAIEVPDRPH